MRAEWLNLILSLTNRIYTQKQELAGSTGVRGARGVFVLIFLEIFLAFISIPLYLGLKPASVAAYFKEKGAYEKINFDYNLRRVLTLTGVGIFLLIWMVKLILIISLPRAYGPLPLYRVGPLEPVDMLLNKELASASTAFQTARLVNTMPRPELKDVRKVRGGNFVFSGSGQPGLEAVLLLSEKNTVIYSGVIDKDGRWQIEHLQSSLKLSEGNHSILVFSFDSKTGTRSEVTDEQFFKVTTTWTDSFVKNVDVLANWSVALIIIMGVLLTFLTL